MTGGDSPRSRPPSASTFALVLAFLSGAASLTHELAWTRRMTDVIGGGSASAALTLGVFFLGLAAGAAWTASRSVRRPWRGAGRVELAIAILSLPALTLPLWTSWIWPALGPERLTSWPGLAVRGLLAVAAILPPAIAMGMTLPWMSQGMATPKAAARVYGANLLGGVVGLAASIAWLLPGWGLFGVMACALGLNLLVAAGCFRLDRRDRDSTERLSEGAEAEETKTKPKNAVRFADWRRALPSPADLALSFASGWGVLAIETIGLHLFAMVVPSATQAASAILAVILLVLAIAAHAANLAKDALKPMPIALSLSGIACALAPAIFTAQTEMRYLEPSADAPRFLGRMLGLALLTIGPCLFAAGWVFPLLAARCDRAGGRGLGALLAVNGAGGLTGVACGQLWLLPTFGPHLALGIVGIVYAVCGWVVSPRGSTARLWGWSALGASMVWTIVHNSGLPELDLSRVQTVRQLSYSGDGVVAVVDHYAHGKALMVRNQYTLGSSNGQDRQIRLGSLPLGRHPQPQHVAYLGLATGTTASAALGHPSVRSITAIELSPQVIAAARDWFGSENHGMFDDPRVRVVAEDARTYLASVSESGRFDVIIGDLFFPWEAGAGRLYSLEHFQAARRALKPGGVFCQWLPLYQLTEPQARSIIATFRQAFGPIEFLSPDQSRTAPVLGLVGYRDRNSSSGRSPGLGRKFEAAPFPGAINTLSNAWIEFDASRERISGGWGGKYLASARWVEFRDKLRASFPDASFLSNP